MKSVLWGEIVQRMRERLIEPILWFPYPALIGFGLVIILRGQLISGLNHRVGSMADVVHLAGEKLVVPGIWISISQEKDQLILVTDDHRRFAWPLNAKDMSVVKPLVEYLNLRTKDEAFKSTLALEVDRDRIRAVLAVDQSLKYIHIRPILFALVEAKISYYGFETRVVN